MNAYMNLLQFMLFVFVNKGSILCVSLDEFYPFGSMHGDTRAPTNDDGSTAAIPISSLFPFFNNQHDSLIVNTNGVISFLGTMSTFTPSPFPLGSNRRLIAPYWTDVDTGRGGEIWYRETTNSMLLANVSKEIRYFFPQQYRFQASWMFIATWNEVAFYGANSVGSQKRCTFQCILATNGRHSFTFFLYNKTEWTTGTASGGDSSTGLGGTPAQVGFDAGDGVNYFALDASRTPQILGVTGMSNIDVPGKFLFRVDSADIEEGGCNTDGTLTISPNEASMFGGTQLVVSGPCFYPNDSTSLVLFDNLEFPCKVMSENSASCISPPVYQTGKETAVLKISRNSSEVLEFIGVIYLVNHAFANYELLRQPTVWKHGSVVQVLWNPSRINFQNGAAVVVDLYYPEVQDNSSIVLEHYSTTTPITPTHFENGVYSFYLNFTLEAAIIRFSNEDTDSAYYWSDMFTVKGYVQNYEACDRWINDDLANQMIDTNLTNPCPCNLEAMEIDFARFHLDPLCIEIGTDEFHCQHQEFASVCFRQNAQTSDGYDSQCCYDEEGLLMNPDWLQGSGYVHRYHYDGGNNNIPFLSNFVFDVVPYQRCCVYPLEEGNNGSCINFFNRRPPNSCVNYVPPAPVRTSGDPHFVTFDGIFYTFNAVGEFMAISDNNFTLQLRLEQFGNSQGSSVTAIAVQPYDHADIIQIQPNTIRGVDVLINGERLDFENSISKVFAVTGATIRLISGNPPSVTASFEKPELSVRANAQLNILNVLLMMSSEEQGEDFLGLYGNKDGIKENDLRSRGGEIVNSNSSMADIHNLFGLSWRVTASESLFHYPSGKTYFSYQDHSFNPVISMPDVIPSFITEVCGSNAECIYDYHVTGDENIGRLSANFSAQFDVILTFTATDSSSSEISTTNEMSTDVADITTTETISPIKTSQSTTLDDTTHSRTTAQTTTLITNNETTSESGKTQYDTTTLQSTTVVETRDITTAPTTTQTSSLQSTTSDERTTPTSVQTLTTLQSTTIHEATDPTSTRTTAKTSTLQLTVTDKTTQYPTTTSTIFQTPTSKQSTTEIETIPDQATLSSTSRTSTQTSTTIRETPDLTTTQTTPNKSTFQLTTTKETTTTQYPNTTSTIAETSTTMETTPKTSTLQTTTTEDTTTTQYPTTTSTIAETLTPTETTPKMSTLQTTTTEETTTTQYPTTTSTIAETSTTMETTPKMSTLQTTTTEDTTTTQYPTTTSTIAETSTKTETTPTMSKLQTTKTEFTTTTQYPTTTSTIAETSTTTETTPKMSTLQTTTTEDTTTTQYPTTTSTIAETSTTTETTPTMSTLQTTKTEETTTTTQYPTTTSTIAETSTTTETTPIMSTIRTTKIEETTTTQYPTTTSTIAEMSGIHTTTDSNTKPTPYKASIFGSTSEVETTPDLTTLPTTAPTSTKTSTYNDKTSDLTTMQTTSQTSTLQSNTVVETHSPTKTPTTYKTPTTKLETIQYPTTTSEASTSIQSMTEIKLSPDQTSLSSTTNRDLTLTETTLLKSTTKTPTRKVKEDQTSTTLLSTTSVETAIIHTSTSLHSTTGVKTTTDQTATATTYEQATTAATMGIYTNKETTSTKTTSEQITDFDQTKSSTALTTEEPKADSQGDSKKNETMVIVISSFSSFLGILIVISIAIAVFRICKFRRHIEEDQPNHSIPRSNNGLTSTGSDRHLNWRDYFSQKEPPLFRGSFTSYQPKYFGGIDNLMYSPNERNNELTDI